MLLQRIELLGQQALLPLDLVVPLVRCAPPFASPDIICRGIAFVRAIAPSAAPAFVRDLAQRSRRELFLRVGSNVECRHGCLEHAILPPGQVEGPHRLDARGWGDIVPTTRDIDEATNETPW